MPPETRIIPSPYKTAASFRNGIYRFSFSACLAWLNEQGKVLFGDHFRIYREDHLLIYKLLVYAIADEENIRKQNMCPEKGILLTGPVGCGKTTLITLINYFFPQDRRYRILPVRDISFEFERVGYQLIHRYSKNAFRRGTNGPIPITFCFDDLGIEQPQKYFGNQCHVMAEILLSRYDLFVSQSMMTHLTTNLSASELESVYGNRLRSRMREMFNLVAFDKGSLDKRS